MNKTLIIGKVMFVCVLLNRMTAFCILMFLTLGVALPAAASSVYVYQQAGIAKYDADGSNGVNIPSNGWDVAAFSDDPVNDYIYRWTTYSSGRQLARDTDPTNSTGSDVTILYSYNNWNYRYSDMDFDPLNRNLYYSEDVYGGTGRTYLIKHNVDSNNRTTLYSASTTTNNFGGVAVDPLNDYIYWTDGKANTVNRRSLSGSTAIEVLYSGLVNPTGLAIDVNAGTLFWTEVGNNSNNYDSFIKSGRVNGTGPPTTLISYDGTSHDPVYMSLDVDPSTRTIYFTGQYSFNQVKTMDYNGQNVQNFTTSSGSQISGWGVDVSSTANLTAIPEPSTTLLVGSGLLGLVVLQRKRRRL